MHLLTKSAIASKCIPSIKIEGFVTSYKFRDISVYRPSAPGGVVFA